MTEAQVPAVVDVSQFAIVKCDAQEFASIVEENCGPEGVNLRDLDVATFPSGTGLSFQVQDIEDDDPVEIKEITGVIIYKHPHRAYHQLPMDHPDSSRVPDCYSEDCIHGIAMSEHAPAERLCTQCPHNIWGSGKNGGKACGQRLRLFVMQPDSILPLVVDLPTMSLKSINKYLTRLTKRQYRLCEVLTTIKLKQEANKSGTKFAMATFRGTPLSPEDAQMFRSIREQFVPLLSNVRDVPIDDNAVSTDDIPEDGLMSDDD